MKKILFIFVILILASGYFVYKKSDKEPDIKKSIDNPEINTTRSSALLYKNHTDETENKIELYAKLKTFSSSGGMKFYYYDPEKENYTKGVSGNDWFWGGVFRDKKSVNSFVKYVEEDKNAIFKIAGNIFENDCDYIDGLCLENIEIEKIDRIK